MRLRRFWRRFEKRLFAHKHFLPASVAVLLLAIAVLLVYVLRDNAVKEFTSSRLDDTNIVLLHVDNNTQVLPTRENTVGDLLDNAGVDLHEGDVVEPGVDAKIEEDDFRINIYRAAPVVIYDGEAKTYSYSAATTPRSIAEQAKIKLYAEDELSTEPPKDFMTDGIGNKVVIDRAVPISLNLYGKSHGLRTQAETVQELLDERGVVLAEGDSIRPSGDTKIRQNMAVFVTRFGVKVVTEEEKIEMPIEVVFDKSLSYGTVAVRQKGSKGVKSVTYEIETKNGKETNRKKIQEVVITKPVKQIEAHGTRGLFEDFDEHGIPARVFCGSPHQRNWKNINTYNARIGRDMAAEYGWSGAQFSALLELWACESSWNHRAGNPFSGAYGIPQAWPAEKMASKSDCGGSDYESNPRTQMSWGLCYIRRRFGSPSAALDYHYRNNFY